MSMYEDEDDLVEEGIGFYPAVKVVLGSQFKNRVEESWTTFTQRTNSGK